MRAIARRFASWLDQTFMLVYGDMLLGIDLADLLPFHQSSSALLKLALKHAATPHNQGMVELDAAGRMRRFVEKARGWPAATWPTPASTCASRRSSTPSPRRQRLRPRYHPRAPQLRRHSIPIIGAVPKRSER
jgi:hypothetical protein